MKKAIAFLLLPFFAFLFIRVETKFWDGKSKVAVASVKKSGDIVITSLDPGSDGIVDILVPGDTQVEMARGFGELRVGSVEQLGTNEGLDGTLLVETITKNFKIPVYIWVTSKGITNQGIGDKFHIALFSLGKKHTEIDLAKSSYLKSVKLKDGHEGHVIFGKIPEAISALFTDTEAARENLKVNIKDATGEYSVAKRVGGIIEVLGAKTALITNEKTDKFDCFVAGKNKDFTKKVALVFGCKVSDDATIGNFDLEIKLGEDFGKRF